MPFKYCVFSEPFVADPSLWKQQMKGANCDNQDTQGSGVQKVTRAQPILHITLMLPVVACYCWWYENASRKKRLWETIRIRWSLSRFPFFSVAYKGVAVPACSLWDVLRIFQKRNAFHAYFRLKSDTNFISKILRMSIKAKKWAIFCISLYVFWQLKCISVVWQLGFPFLHLSLYLVGSRVCVENVSGIREKKRKRRRKDTDFFLSCLHELLKRSFM